MNKHLHRIVFNAARGMRMVVQETADGSVAIVGQGWGIWDETTETTRDQAMRTDPARLVAGGNLTVDGFLHNRDSQVLAGGTLGAAGTKNEATTGTQATTTTTLVTGYMASKPGTGPNNFSVLGPTTSSSTVDVGAFRYEGNTHATTSGKAPGRTGSSANVDANADAAGGVSGTARAGAIVEVPAHVGAVVKTAGGSAGTASGPDGTASTQAGSAGGNPRSTVPMVVRTSAPNASIPTASLFSTRPDPGSRYLVETDARFASYRSWLGSDDLLGRLGLNPDLVQKRLGDGFYEQRLIREQIAQLTGYRYLNGYDSDEAQHEQRQG